MKYRRPSFESLESRQLLSVTLPSISDQTVLSGTTLNLALQGVSSGGNALSYAVQVSDSNLTNGAQLTAAVPTGNTSLKLVVNDAADGITNGVIIIQLADDLAPETVSQILTLVEDGYYNGLTFHRIIEDFMIQGGDPDGDGSGGPEYDFDDEFDASLQFTGAGVVAMANSGSDTNGSQFFITTDDARWLDYRYSIFGFVTEGSDVVDALDSIETDSNDAPVNTVTITSIEVYEDTQNGVLRLSAPNGTTGTATVTVTATDTVTGETAVQPFQVTVSADSTSAPPFLGDIDPVETSDGTAVTFTIPAVNVDGLTLTYSATSNDSELTVAVDSSTGVVTVTPAEWAYGVFSIKVGVASSSAVDTSADTQVVPVYVSPAAPSSITLLEDYDTGTSASDGLTNLNNSGGAALQFEVSGVVPGATVELFANGVSIGSATVSGTSVTITTDGTTTLDDGDVAITAKQTLADQAVEVGNLNTTTDLASAVSSALTVRVATAAPGFTFVPVTTAREGAAYTCQVTTETEYGGAMTYALTEAPDGMTINASTGLIAWTPGEGTSEESPFDVTVEATDAAGNSAEKSFTVNVAAANTAAPELTAASPTLGSTDEDTAFTVEVWEFVNNGDGTTEITDEDEDAIVGGIALTATTGSGTWAYSTDGETFVSIGTVSASSAFLVPADAFLRYTPGGDNGETATITYRAWDTTSGASGDKVDTTTSGGTTAFSTDADTASLTVSDVNDAPELTAASPSLGGTDPSTAVIVALSTFINTSGATAITDVDDDDEVGGIALTGTTGSGTWAYSLDGGSTYTSVGVVSATSSLLLPADALLRYTPSGASETATITYRAWDATSGDAGDAADTTTNGGETAFSSATDTASLSVNAAPVLAADSPTLDGTDENTAVVVALSDFINNDDADSSTTITDADEDAEVGGIALTGTTGNGTWAYSLDGGSTYTSVGTVSSTSALLLPADALLRYTPDGENGETATITYRAWDTTAGTAGGTADTTDHGDYSTFSTATDTASLTVSDVNDAPVLETASPSLGTVTDGAATVIALSDFINSDGGTTVTDVDDDAETGGIALTATTGAGTWAYSLDDGSTYTSVGTVSSASALLLPADALLRYTPADAESDTATITYRAWDATAGTAGDKADTTTSGGATAFSSASDTASLTVSIGGTASISGYVYADTNNDGARTRPDGSLHVGLPGVAIHLLMDDGDGNWTEVAAVLTGSDGSYSFTGLAAGTYRIQEDGPASFLDGIDTLGTVGGTSKGTAGNDQFDVTLAAGESGVEYNFGERGLRPGMVSLRCFLASSASGSKMLMSLNASPVLNLSASLSGTGYSATHQAGGAAVAIAGWDAAITDADSTMLAWMTVTLANRPDGDSEVLAADTSGTLLTTSYSGGVLTISGAATLADYEAVLTTVTYSNTDSSPQAGNRTIYVKVSDGIEESNTAVATVTVESSSEAPSGYSITANDSLVNAGEAAAFGFTFAGAEVGATYNYTVTSSGGSGSVTGSGTVSSATQNVTGIDVSSLTDGTLTISVTLTDTDGNAGAAATATATLDQTAPSGYTITANDSLVDAEEASAFGFTFAGAEVGATYAYTIVSSGGSGSVTGSGTISSATQSITGIDISSLVDGTLTVSVTLTDPAGNAGSAATATATLENAPVGYAITVDDSMINGDEAPSTGFTFSGAEVGATFSYTVTSSGGTGSVTGSGTISSATQQVTGIDVSALPDGTLTYSATLTDSDGNVGAAVTATATLDRIAPTGYTITPDDALINFAEAVSVGFTFAGAEVGATYSYTVTSSGGTGSVTGNGTISSATQQVTGVDVSSLPDGILTFSVTLTDAAGNAGSAATAVATLDQNAPYGYSIALDDDEIIAVEAASFGFTFSNAEVGATYHYSVIGSATLSGSGVVTSADQHVTGIDISSLPDGTYTFGVTLVDEAGNTGGTVTADFTLDNAPLGYSIAADQSLINADEASATSFTFAGAEIGATYNYTVTSSGGEGSVTGSGTIASATQQVTGIDVSSLPDGTLTYRVTLTDTAGNVGAEVTADTALDKTAPSAYTVSADDSLIGEAEAASVGFTFTDAEVGAAYSYTVSSSGGEGSVTGGGTIASATQQVTGIDVSALPEGALTFSVTLTDEAGNSGGAVTATATLDQTAPSGYSITADDNLVNATEAASTGFTFAGAELGAAYSYTVTSSGGGGSVTGTGTITSATQQVTGIDVSALPDGTLTYSVTLTDPAGNAGSAVTADATLDRTAPAGYSITADDDLINATEAAAAGFTFAGAEVGAAYTYTVTSSGGEGSVTGSGTITSATQQVTGIDVSSLPDGVLTFSVTLTNALGNVGAAATAVATLDKTAPSGYSITPDDDLINSDEASSTSFTFAGAEAGATYSYTVTSSDDNAVMGSGTVGSAAQQVTGIDVSALSDGTITYSVILTDAAGNVGSPATATATLDKTAAAVDAALAQLEDPF